MPATSTSSTKGPALTFDPRYMEYVIATWQKQDFAPILLDQLIAEATAYAEEKLVELNAMGLLEEDASSDEVKKVVNLFKSLKLVKQVTVGPKGAKVTKVGPTPDGRDIFSEPPATGGIRQRLVSLLVANSATLKQLLRALSEHRPLAMPVRNPLPGAPLRGAAYISVMAEGIELFRAQSPHINGQNGHRTDVKVTSKKLTAPQLLKNATDEALSRHPAGKIAQLDKLAPLASALGLVWADTRQLNDMVAERAIGASVLEADGTYAPNTPSWEEISSTFLKELLAAQGTRADGTGFATIDELRGALGRSLHLSAPVVDELICHARDAADRREAAIELHFEPDEERVYSRGRHPLIWKRHAFDFVGARSLVGLRTEGQP